jgi:peptidoglycan/xylan/chitin deacetylase (PgdA/CDA1 family)
MEQHPFTVVTLPQNLDAGGGAHIPAVFLCFDDGEMGAYTYAYPHLQARHMSATTNIIAVSAAGSSAGALHAPQLVELDAVGWDIGNHTYDHVNLTTLTQANAQSQLRLCREYLESIGVGDAARHVGYPYGAFNATTDAAMTAEGMLTGRGGECDTFALETVNLYRLCSQGIENITTLDDVKGWIDNAIAEQGVAGILFHYLKLDGDLATGWWYVDNFKAVIDYIIAQHIQPLTVSQLYALRSGPVEVIQPW